MTNIFATYALAVSLIGSGLIIVYSVWRMIYGASKHSMTEIVSLTVFIASASLLAMDLLQEARMQLGGNQEMLFTVGSLGLFFFVTAFAHRAIQTHGTPIAIRRNTHAWLLILLSCSMAGWSYYRLQVKTFQLCFTGDAIPITGDLREDSHKLGATDEGTFIPLYRFDASDEIFENFVATSSERYRQFASTTIHRENADRMANCHGWVFTAGRFLLKGIDVDRILCENHYYVVTEPKPGDIVIYRSMNGSILHTALVQGILQDGTVMTESKWGIDQRFLHLPADQPYSSIYEYYRTDRPSHVISIRDTSPDYDDENG